MTHSLRPLTEKLTLQMMVHRTHWQISGSEISKEENFLESFYAKILSKPLYFEYSEHSSFLCVQLKN